MEIWLKLGKSDQNYGNLTKNDEKLTNVICIKKINEIVFVPNISKRNLPFKNIKKCLC